MEAVDIPLEQLEAAVRRLPPDRRKDVLLFIEFLEYSMHLQSDAAEDADLWKAVEAHQAYRTSHPDEQADVFDSAEAFLRATEDL